MSVTTTVPKPDDAGNGQTAIADTKLAFANIRSGPGTNYRDIGDLRDNSLVVYYPNSRTDDGWVYIEYRGVSGWMSTSVVSFEATIGGTIDQPTTPYDGQVAVWHWKGDAIPETSIEAFAQNLTQRAPRVNAVWVKVSEGSSWQGEFDRSSMAVNGISDVRRWVDILGRYGLEFHAWCVPQGIEIPQETAIISAVCQEPGVKSMILDVEPFAGFWQGGQAGIRPFMIAIRSVISADFHLGLSVDPRPWHYDSIFPEEWYPFVGSVHPQVYWATFRSTPAEALEQAYETWASYGRPMIPVLQGDAPLVDQTTAHTLATQRYGATGLSWWRYGVIAQFDAVNTPIDLPDPTDPPDEPTDHFADEVVIQPLSDGFRSGNYGNKQFQQFDGTWNWPVLYVNTEPQVSEVWAEWKTTLPQSGRYEISVFVPARHATTTRARYKIHGIRGTTTEVIILINQYLNRNRWVSLGIFDLVKDQPNAGRVFLNDVTGEVDKEIAFDAVRFRRIVTSNNPDDGTPDETDRPSEVDGVPVADGYDSPVGTEEKRRGDRLWPAGWLDASPFAQLYFVGTPSEAYHTGADLNFGAPYEDRGMPTYACTNGVVIFAGSLRVWGNVIVIRHDPLYLPDGQVLYSRYGHVQNMSVNVGDRVVRGQQIAEIGDGFGRFVPHLHFDLSPTTVLETRPSDWPGTNLASLLRNYIDPLAWIQRNRP